MTLRDVPSVACSSVDFLNIFDKFSNTFKCSFPGGRKVDTGNGLLGVSIISISDLVTIQFDDKDSNWHCCGETPLCNLRAMMPYSWHIFSNIGSNLARH